MTPELPDNGSPFELSLLESLTTNELVEELFRRHEASVIVFSTRDGKVIHRGSGLLATRVGLMQLFLAEEKKKFLKQPSFPADDLDGN